jgi:hypothetical protein
MVNRQRRGPFTLDELEKMAASGKLTRKTPLWEKGMQWWEQAGTVLNGIWWKPAPARSPAKYYIVRDKKRGGPFSIDQLKKMAASGKFTQEIPVWRKGMKQWAKAGSVKDLDGLWAKRAPAATTMRYYRYYIVRNKKRSGPFVLDQLKKMVITGSIDRETYIWRTGTRHWVKAGTVKELDNMWVKRVPAAANSATKTAKLSSAEYYIEKDHIRSGPFSLEELRKKVAGSGIDRATYVWRVGTSKWVMIGSLKELADVWPVSNGQK